MRGVCVYLVLGVCLRWASAQFLNHRPFPTYSLENMPDTEFSCRDKILGGYYADADTECQMFHICVKVAGVGVQDFRFLCPNGTAFDQDHQICADWEDVDCDATTLYYSSDNFDLYRIGSGFESKAVKYGEDEETFALQRAETGDHRLNREHQVQNVNQQRETAKIHRNNNNNNYNKPKSQQNNEERDIFKGSSSSNFFNNKNNGKETDEDYDDGNVNINQDRDSYQRRKIVRKQHRRPLNQGNDEDTYKTKESVRTTEPPKQTQNVPRNRHQNTRYNNNNNNRNTNDNNRNNNNNNYNDNNNYRNNNNNDNNYNQQDNYEEKTSKPQRPTGFANNFAGSSYVPTTSKPSSTTINNDQYTTALNNYRQRNGNRVRGNYNNADNFRQTQESDPSTPTYTVSTPAPFRQSSYNAPQRHNNNYNNGQYNPTTSAPKKVTENYPTTTPKQNYPSDSTRNTQTYNNQYDIPKTKQTENYPSSPIIPKKTDNYPSNNPQFSNFDKKPTTPLKQTENYPTTSAPKTSKNQPAPFTHSNQKPTENLPTTFAPRTNAGYTHISQQTTQYKSTNQQQNPSGGSTQHFNPPVPSTQYNNQPSTFKQQNSTPKTSPFTHYTPTVPKITSTTPVSRTVSRSSRYDETSYDDGAYDSKYDDNGEESLKTAHSQNIANSRNEYNNRQSKPVQRVTQKPYHESPRPFSVSPNTPKVTDYPRSTVSAKSTPKPIEQPKKPVQGAPKRKDYDYAYYDTNVGSEPEYEIDADIKKSTVKN